MKKITEIVPGQPSREPLQLSDQERDSVAYFFVKLKLIDPRFYDEILPDETTERFVKREHAGLIGKHSRDKIDKAFEGLKLLMGENHPDYKRLTISKVIGLLTNGGSPDAAPAGIYKLSPPVIKPPLAIGSTLESMRAHAVEVLNPQTGEYSIAIAAPKTNLTRSDKAKAEETLGRLGSLFGEDE